MTRIFVPQDVAALAVGANKVAAKIAAEAQARGLPIEIIRTGSRGMFFLEPLIEVETAQGRIGYGPVSAADVASLFDAGLLDGGAHALRIGKPEVIHSLRRRRGSPSPAAASSIRSRWPIMRRMTAGRGLNAPSRSVLRRSSIKSRNPGFAAAAAPVFRPASNGRPLPIRRPTGNMSCATSTKVTAAPSPTA